MSEKELSLRRFPFFAFLVACSAAAASAQTHPDLSGIWRKSKDGSKVSAGNLAADGVEVPFQPWAEALYNARRENNGKGVPSERCLPHSIPKTYLIAEPTKIVQTPALILILHREFNNYPRGLHRWPSVSCRISMPATDALRVGERHRRR